MELGEERARGGEEDRSRKEATRPHRAVKGEGIHTLVDELMNLTLGEVAAVRVRQPVVFIMMMLAGGELTHFGEVPFQK